MPRIVKLSALDVMEAYHCVVVWTPSTSKCDICILQRAPFLSLLNINKGCAEAECLYSSISASTSLEVLICSSWQDTGVYCGHPPPEYHSLHTDPANSFFLGPVHEWTPMNNCCYPLRLESECPSCRLDDIQLVDPTK